MQHTLQRAMMAFNQGQYHATVQTLSPHIHKVAHPQAWLMYGIAGLQIGQFDLAMPYLEKVLKHDPGNERALMALARAHLNQGRAEQALGLFQRVKPTHGSGLQAQLGVAEAWQRLDQHGKAVAQLDQARRQYGAQTSAMVSLAMAYKQANRLRPAAELYHDFLRHKPDDLVASFNLAVVDKMRGRLAEARAVFERLAPRLENREPFYDNYGSVLRLQGEYEAAARVYREGLKRFPHSHALRHWLTELLWGQGDKDWDQPYRALSLAQAEHRPGIYQWATKLAQAGESDKALSLLAALTRHERDPDWLSQYSWQLQQARQFDDALQQGRAALELAPNHLEARRQYARALLGNLEFEAARKIIEPVVGRCRASLPLYCTALRFADPDAYGHYVDYHTMVTAISLDDVALGPLADCLHGIHTTTRQPLGQSLRRGTQTLEHLFDRPEPELQALKGAILAAARRHADSLKVEAGHPLLGRAGQPLEFIGSWSVRLNQGGFHASHHHEMGWLSGVTYVGLPSDLGADGHAGWLHFGRPGFETRETIEADRWVQPAPGRLVLFPSYFWHGTQPFQADEQRLTVAFDLRCA